MLAADGDVSCAIRMQGASAIIPKRYRFLTVLLGKEPIRREALGGKLSGNCNPRRMHEDVWYSCISRA
jgi:hypothetical protein